jgi:large subunit ribosomal protein L28
MSKICEVCGKGSHVGSIIVRKGLPKKKGGIGLHTTGISKRRFLPNVQRVRAKVAGVSRSVTVCTGCLKAGKIQKAK